METKPSDRIESSAVVDFWDAARSSCKDHEETGYLSDGWPVEIAMQRFVGEWDWIQRHVLPLVSNRQACLDFGCGTGLWLKHLALLFERAEGIDSSRGMIDAARSKLDQAGLEDVKLSHGQLQDLPGDSKFDLIFVGGVLMYLNDNEVPGVLAELRSRLTPDGIIVFRESTYRKQTYYRDSPIARGLLSPPDAERPRYQAVYRTTDSLRALMEESGLNIQRVQANRFYKFVDMKKSQLRLVNRLMRNRLSTDAEAAARWARRIHRFRALTCYPTYYFCRSFHIPAWNMDNHWFVCRRA